MKLQKKFSGVAAHLNGSFINREGVVRGLLTALVAGEHVLMLGPPGTGKSALAEALYRCFGGASVYSYLMTKFTTPEEVFGPVALSALKQDRFERVLDGRAAKVEGLFMDEIFKANSSILNSLLSLLNERIFDNGGKRESVPLVMAVGASNELPEDKSLQALFDRFVVRFWIDYVQGQDQFNALLSLAPVAPPPVLQLSDIEQAQKEAAALPLADDLLFALWEIKTKLSDNSIPVSDRTWRKMLRLAQAAAWLRGSATCEREDVEVLSDALWTEPAQRPIVASVVLKVANPAAEEAQRIVDMIVHTAKVFPFEALAGSERDTTLPAAARMNREIKAAIGELEKLAKGGNTRIAALLRKAKEAHQSVSRAITAATA